VYQTGTWLRQDQLDHALWGAVNCWEPFLCPAQRPEAMTGLISLKSNQTQKALFAEPEIFVVCSVHLLVAAIALLRTAHNFEGRPITGATWE
jgi:hypothetical protein